MWIKNSFFKYCVGLILILLIIFLLGQIDFFLAPFKKFVTIIFSPILISGLLYYLFRPLVGFAKKMKLPPTLAILTVFLVVIITFSLLGIYAGSLVGKQFQLFIGDMPQIIQATQNKGIELINNEKVSAIFTGNFEQQITSYLKNIVPALSSGLMSTISTITSIASVLVVVPFILFYLLKDDYLFLEIFLNTFPKKYRREVSSILTEADNTMSVYIIGQAIIALILGVLTFVGYIIIGLNYAFILSLFVLITSFIPLFGSIIGVIPALLVGISAEPLMGLKVLIIMVIVQQIEGNFISPNLIGKRMDIHPLTIILIFLGAASLYGFIGMLIVVPAYAVLKILLSGAIRLYKIWKGGNLLSN